METRITLRLNKELDELLEDVKEKTGMSKNLIIATACKNFIEDIERTPNQKGIKWKTIYHFL